VTRMRGWTPRLVAWADELGASSIPISVDHVDFLPHNAVVQADGSVLVYDWEQAVVGCPLFSLDVLFLYAQQISRGDDWLVEPERETPETHAVRRAYLEALPWGSPADRARAFDLAMCLSPIRYAWIEQRMAIRHGNERQWSNNMAWWLTRALARWERLRGDSFA
jgi:thiamine kinase-like enzyme